MNKEQIKELNESIKLYKEMKEKYPLHVDMLDTIIEKLEKWKFEVEGEVCPNCFEVNSFDKTTESWFLTNKRLRIPAICNNCGEHFNIIYLARFQYIEKEK